MRRQERKNAVRLEKMTGYRLGIQQLTLTIRSTLHPKIIANNQRKGRPPRRIIQDTPSRGRQCDVRTPERCDMSTRRRIAPISMASAVVIGLAGIIVAPPASAEPCTGAAAEAQPPAAPNTSASLWSAYNVMLMKTVLP
jgi:hypothetical protein